MWQYLLFKFVKAILEQNTNKLLEGTRKMKLFYASFVLLFSIFIFSNSSCKKEELISKDPSAKLLFSEDTIIFDTVFTSIGSTTKILKIYNPLNRKLIVSSIVLGGGENSPYRLNIDGLKKNSTSNIEIGAKDSLYIFVAVTINPNNASSPLIVSDSIMFETNGNPQKIKLVAWGQDAYYFRPTNQFGNLKYSVIAGENENIVLNSDKPYVVYGYAVVDSSAKLTIPAGAKLFFSKNSGLWVYRGGSLKVEGSFGKPVVFAGTRQEEDYRDQNGQWDRIWINEGANCSINFAIIKNAFIGIQAETIIGRWLPDETKLRISNTIIKNMSGAGILSRYFNIYAFNNLIYNCGGYCAALSFGGNYTFTNNTFANYWSFPIRKTPALFINNYNEIQDFPLDSCYFGNCIIDGNLEEEIKLDASSNTSFAFNYKFENCITKINSSTFSSNQDKFVSCINNSSASVNGSQNGFYKDLGLNDYTLKDNSPAIGAGNFSLLSIFNNTFDLNNETFSNPPSIGAYEKH